MKNSSSYNSLLGKSKKEVIIFLGDAFNFFPSDKWIYFLSTDWFGRKKFLVVHFDNDIVKRIETKISFFDISNF